MKKWLRLLAVPLLLVPLWAAYQAFTPASASAPLHKFIPAGALLYLEAKDFSSLLAEWSTSPEKTAWLKSDNYRVFSHSRLFLRLGDAQKEFAAAASLAPDMNFLSQVAGRESAFAWYDIGKLEFLYISRNAKAAAQESALWQSRSKFEPRSVAGLPFYIRTDAQTHRVVAFAVAGDYLILATREDLMAGALQLLSGAPVRSIETDGWWTRSVAKAGAPGDLRMVLNLDSIVASPYFRSYWIQRNVTDMKQYVAAISDLYRSGAEYREERILLRRSAPDMQRDAAGARAAVEMAALVPDGSGLFRAVADPAPDQALAALQTKLLGSAARQQARADMAPPTPVTTAENTVGATDFESRIDQPPPTLAVGPGTDDLKRLLTAAGLTAMLELHSSTPDSGGVFVRPHSLVALAARSDWRIADLQSALSAALEPSMTAGQLGIAWRQNPAGYVELDGLFSLAIAVRGKQMFLADDPKLLAAVLGGPPRQPSSEPAVYIAGFNHARERADFNRITGVLARASQPDTTAQTTPGSPEGTVLTREPDFLSRNIGSLSQALAAVISERVTVRDMGDTVLQKVVYEWGR